MSKVMFKKESFHPFPSFIGPGQPDTILVYRFEEKYGKGANKDLRLEHVKAPPYPPFLENRSETLSKFLNDLIDSSRMMPPKPGPVRQTPMRSLPSFRYAKVLK